MRNSLELIAPSSLAMIPEVEMAPTSGAFRAIARARYGVLGAARRRQRIVVAEDDPEMRHLVAEALRKDGYEVVEAQDGGRLLVQVTARYVHPDDDVDLIVSDNRMPVCTGLEVLKGLRDAHRLVPVIVMTGFGDRATREAAEALGAIVFDKPFSIDDLRTAVLNLLPS